MTYFIETVLADIFEVDELRHKFDFYAPCNELKSYIKWINTGRLRDKSGDNYYVSYHGMHICQVNDIRQIWEEE